MIEEGVVPSQSDIEKERARLKEQSRLALEPDNALFVFCNPRFEGRFASRFGSWQINPKLLSFGLMQNPNNGEGLDDVQLEYLANRLMELVKDLRKERRRRGAKRQPYIDRACQLYVAASEAEDVLSLPANQRDKEIWKRVWDDPAIKAALSSKDVTGAASRTTKKKNIRQAVVKRLQRESTQERPEDSAV